MIVFLLGLVEIYLLCWFLTHIRFISLFNGYNGTVNSYEECVRKLNER